MSSTDASRGSSSPNAEALETDHHSPDRPDSPNAEAIEAWDGPLYERFVQFRPIVTTGLGAHGEVALALVPPRPGQRVLDIGCGFGDTTQRIRDLVGPHGEVVGVDASARFIETARAEAAQGRPANVRYAVADVQTDDLGGPYELAFSRFGTMFFANPVAALANVRRALGHDGRLVMVVWRRREDNDWLYRAETIVEGIVSRPAEYEEPTCGPGPFSMADADVTSEILFNAGFAEISLQRCDLPITIGRDREEAVDMVMAIGPAGEILRLSGERAADLHEDVRRALRDGLAEFEDGDEIRAPASTWIVSARAARH
jgi:ubiquinone/menaquinone biosynthesis C-methylase UbiE